VDGDVTYALNETHNPDALSWVASANRQDTDFPIQNLPFGVFRRAHDDDDDRGHVGVAIGDCVVDLEACHAAGLFDGRASEAGAACTTGRLNALCTLGRRHWSILRARISELLRANHPNQRQNRALVEPLLVAMADVTLDRPVDVGDYTDFYASIHHATRVGSIVRPEAPLLPNYKYVPIAYHGRASSIVVSGTPVRRPCGQIRRGEDPPVVAPSARLDFELEAGFIVGPGNALGERITIGDADTHLFGMVLLNDWSARDLQLWEAMPLGPFLGKNFATSISAWVVTLEALEPFRAPAPERAPGDPAPLPHLNDEAHCHTGGLDVGVEAWLRTARMRDEGVAAVRLCRSSLLDLYWTPGQMVAHHTSNGCNLRPGDIIASGTVSGPAEESRGCLLEGAGRGFAVSLPTGEERRFLEDGDEVILRGAAARAGMPRLGFGECRGVIQGSREP
jgi:fumarylacetoacetase